MEQTVNEDAGGGVAHSVRALHPRVPPGEIPQEQRADRVHVEAQGVRLEDWLILGRDAEAVLEERGREEVGEAELVCQDGAEVDDGVGQNQHVCDVTEPRHGCPRWLDHSADADAKRLREVSDISAAGFCFHPPATTDRSWQACGVWGVREGRMIG